MFWQGMNITCQIIHVVGKKKITGKKERAQEWMRHKKGENKDRHSNRDEIKIGKKCLLVLFPNFIFWDTNYQVSLYIYHLDT